MIRVLGPEDAAIWRDVRLAMLLDTPEAFGSIHAEWVDRPLEDFADWLRRIKVFALVEDGRALATVGWWHSDRAAVRHRGEVVSVYVRPEARGRGAGDRLMQTVIDEARGKVVQLELGVGTQNRPARTLYARHGFVEVGRVPRALCHGGRYVDEITMMLRLDASGGDT